MVIEFLLNVHTVTSELLNATSESDLHARLASVTVFLVMLHPLREGLQGGRNGGGLMESILLWTGQNDQLQVMRMDHAAEKIAAQGRRE